MKVSSIITEVRNILGDSNEPYLWSDDDLLSYVRDSLVDIKGHVKHLLTDISSTFSFDYDRFDDDHDVEERYVEALKLGAVYRAYTKHDSELFDGRLLEVNRQLYAEQIMKLRAQLVVEGQELVTSSFHHGLL